MTGKNDFTEFNINLERQKQGRIRAIGFSISLKLFQYIQIYSKIFISN